MGKDNNHVRTKHNHVRTARAVYCDHCDVVIVTSRLVATWCHRLKCPPGWSDPPSRVSCAVSLDPGHGSLDPGGHLCPSPVNSPTNYSRMTSSQPVKTRLPRIAGSSLNHMIRNCPTTSQETFNDGYNLSYHCLQSIVHSALHYSWMFLPRLSHRLEYFTFRTISWSWNSSPTISWLPMRYASVYIIHMFLHVRRAKCCARYCKIRTRSMN